MNMEGYNYLVSVDDQAELYNHQYLGMHKFTAYINSGTFIGFIDLDSGKWHMDSASDFSYADLICLKEILSHYFSI